MAKERLLRSTHFPVRKNSPYHIPLKFEAEVEHALCTVRLMDVEPHNALQSIAEMHDCMIVKEDDNERLSGWFKCKEVSVRRRVRSSVRPARSVCDTVAAGG